MQRLELKAYVHITIFHSKCILCVCLKSIMACNCRSHCCSPAALVWNIRKFRAKKYFTDHWTAKTLKLQSIFNVFLAQRYLESSLPVVQCCAKSGKAASGSGEFQFCNKHWIRWQRVRVPQFLWLTVGVAIIGNFILVYTFSEQVVAKGNSPEACW